MSLALLAEKSGVSAPTLSRLENGERGAAEGEELAIAQALGMPLRALCRPLISERLGLSGFYHRKLSRAGARAVAKIENQCLLDVVALQELFAIAPPRCPDQVLTIQLDDFRGDVEAAANAVRLAWQVPRGPIADVFAVIERAGCIVVHSDFGIPEMDGLYQKVHGVPPVFWVNSRKPLERVRFSVCHELGHLVLHEERPTDNSIAEGQADTFAAAFLMPRTDFRSECPSRLGIPELVELKRRWRCSMSAIARRARDVGRITPKQFTNLMIELSKRGWRTAEPYPISGESPTLLVESVQEALAVGGYSASELADRLAIPVEQVSAWMQRFPGDNRSVGSDVQPFLRLTNGF